MKTAGHPRCERGAALAVLVVLIVVLAASAAIMLPRLSKHNEEFEAVKQELAGAREEVRALEQRPTVEELEAVRTSLAATKADLEKAEGALAGKTRDCEEGLSKIASLGEELGTMRGKTDELTGQLRKAGVLAKGLADDKARLEADLLTTVQSYENARKAASGKEDLLDKLDATAKKLSATERALAAEKEALAAKEAVLLKLQADIDKATADIAERDEAVSRLRKELAEIPIMPLPDELAKQKYYEYLNSVAEFTDRQSRMTTLFRAKIALAGSSYEAKADEQWRREMKKKREDVDRAARLVYDDVNSKIRVHPDAHDENVTLLQAALEKVTGSRYQRIIQQLIDREHELKAAGR
ncbi:MAG: hypothetical protein ACYS9X_09190 [Planctomycetota bacterium]|jgi:uncharacterized protein (DUF3084 family)